MGRFPQATAWTVVGATALAWAVGAGAQQPVAPPYPTTPATPYPTAAFEAPPLAPAPSAPVLPSYADLSILPPPTASQPTPATGAAPTLLPPPAGEAPAVPSPATPTALDPTPESLSVVEPIEPELTAADAIEAPVSWYYPSRWFGPDPWDVGFELGINGSTGTSETLSIRTGGYIQRETDLAKCDLSLYHNKTRADGTETQNNALFKGRHDWMVVQSPWSLYTASQLFYDEFQAFDLNLNVTTGVGLQVIDDEVVKCRLSLGSGASREFGAVDDDWIPEAQCGFDWEQEISKTQRFYADVDYFPNWTDWGEYRVVSDMGLEIDLSVPSNVSLKLSATDRFDSTPNGVRPHNTNYSVLMLWKR